MAEETVNVNPDGSYTYQGEDAGSTMPPAAEEEPIMEAVASSSTDPAIYLLLVMVVLGVLYYVYRTRSKQDDEDGFFSNLDGEKFNLKLPGEVQEYYSVKEKVMAAGWVPGSPPDKTKPQGPHKVMAQALMKRAIADIPIVTHIQKEAAGMNKLYAQSMCSVNQWRAFQAAEAMVSSEVEDVRSEADEIEPGWSQVIWRQAMQYHGMLKKKHEEEQRAIEEQAAKRRAIEETVQAHKSEQQKEKDKVAAAEKAAQELLKEEEREKAKKAFSGGGVKKGFLDKKKKK